MILLREILPIPLTNGNESRTKHFGAAFHDFYTGMVKEKIWNEAVERGYTTKVTTSEGQAFMWKGEDK